MKHRTSVDTARFMDGLLPFAGEMWRTAYTMLRDSDDASDAVQEVFTRLWERRDSIPGPENVRTFCLTVTRRLCIDMLRRRDVRRSVQVEEIEIQSPADVHRALEDTERLRRLERLIGRLTPDQQTVIRLSAYRGCSNGEIRELTGFSADNVRMLLSRGRRKLKELFNDNDR